MTKGWSVPTAWGCSPFLRTAPLPLFPLPLLSRRCPVSPPLPLLPQPDGALGFVSTACCLGEGRRRRRSSTGSFTSSSSTTTTRRTIALLVGSSLGFSAFPNLLIATPVSAAEAEEAGSWELLERYTDQEEGFTLLRPASWLKVDKAGAVVLFQGDDNKANNIGVVVNPVRLVSLKDFGTPQYVADKLIQAERRKESTKDAQMVRIAERVGHGGLPVYEFEYTVDSTRGGLKRIFSAAFVEAKKLYLLNIACSDSSVSPLDGKTRTTLEKVLHSFDMV